MFATLGIFAGGCDPAAARAVCGADEAILALLVDASLVPAGRTAAADARDDPRVRGGASGRAGRRGRRRPPPGRRSCSTSRARPRRTRAGRTSRRGWSGSSSSCRTSAWRWAGASNGGERGLGLQLGDALELLWVRGRRSAEGIRWLEALVALEGDAPPAALAGSLAAAGRCALELGDVERGRAWSAEAERRRGGARGRRAPRLGAARPGRRSGPERRRRRRPCALPAERRPVRRARDVRPGGRPRDLPRRARPFRGRLRRGTRGVRALRPFVRSSRRRSGRGRFAPGARRRRARRRRRRDGARPLPRRCTRPAASRRQALRPALRAGRLRRRRGRTEAARRGGSAVGSRREARDRPRPPRCMQRAERHTSASSATSTRGSWRRDDGCRRTRPSSWRVPSRPRRPRARRTCRAGSARTARRPCRRRRAARAAPAA